ncbi:N-acetyltransferase [Bacillus sp. HMF5848]|uniref:GNAT family N-acetyltransferase n=1 Tax=Bacillus sp. HMF5848 TaxID=2495421 RepID=UPI000F79A919|nr:GNAT family protein [Bacillus sp. HMF5848]RSK27565.1 N-acetyltransferase [Bacillus sp. HMF5848]
MKPNYEKLIEPSITTVEMFNKWENDASIIPLIRPNRNENELEHREELTQINLSQRLENHHIYLIYFNHMLVGEMSYMIDPDHLLKNETGTAWIGITIGEPEGRGKGIGFDAIQYLEKQIKNDSLKRIELGVFEFNMQARRLYEKLGYKECGYIDNFTYWQGEMWTDIRMEKYI